MRLAIRKVQFAPEEKGVQPSAEVEKEFLMSDKPVSLEASLDKNVSWFVVMLIQHNLLLNKVLSICLFAVVQLKMRIFIYLRFTKCCCCCWLPDPFRGMEAWRKTMEPQKPGNSPGSGPEVVQRQRVTKERAAQRVRNWTVQNEMRGVLRPVSTCAARRILDSANPREIRT